MERVTFVAPVNLAVIKYWGKRNEELILPINDSLSATLDTEHLCAKTTVMISPDFEQDKIWLNGCEESIENARLQNCLREVRKRSQLPDKQENWKVHICSENNFPTSAGLASSAAGYACLTVALAKLFNVQGDISAIARCGSGSACRSIYGGFVRWYMGDNIDGSDSISKEVFDTNHWPDMRILILVVNDTKKKVSSSEGMKRCYHTSPFLKYRAENTVPLRIEQMQEAIQDRNFEKFAELTMKDSNEMHAACAAAYPPCFYMNDTSHRIIELVHAYNTAHGEIKAAYTFDAGPNATLFVLEKDVCELYAVINNYFLFVDDRQTKDQIGKSLPGASASSELLKKINIEKQPLGKLKYVIHTRVGTGPKQVLDSENHLLDNQGFPKKLY
ncbi:diphosphomevalonate decarboxylase [Copidosoma floridanum]|uniref:diphosphomevalonate decarboxylase n=1 Tax=Copidosoma floridanum TaxID=29053 RepID=UPI0006C976E2|nr:diphosphomevalonate decarboxylase [Copidosoma floridanum]